MSLHAPSDEFSPSRSKSSEEPIKISIKAECAMKIEPMKIESESQDKYQCFLRWLRSADDCPEIRALNAFILYQAEICDIPFLDEKFIDNFIKYFDFAVSEIGGKSVIQILVEQCEKKMKTVSEGTDSAGLEEDIGKPEIKNLVESCENKMKTVSVKFEVGEELKEQKIEEDEQTQVDRVMESWLDFWFQNFNTYIEYVVGYVGSNLDLVESSRMMEIDEEWVKRRANELDIFMEKLRVMKHRAKSVKETLGAPLLE